MDYSDFEISRLGMTSRYNMLKELCHEIVQDQIRTFLRIRGKICKLLGTSMVASLETYCHCVSSYTAAAIS